MSAYENVVVGKLKLKGKPLEVKSGGIKKKKKHKHQFDKEVLDAGEDIALDTEDLHIVEKGGDGRRNTYDEQLTPAERRYMERWKKIEQLRLMKDASKSHRDRIQAFNQYLANLSEHYDIPKVGPG